MSAQILAFPTKSGQATTPKSLVCPPSKPRCSSSRRWQYRKRGYRRWQHDLKSGAALVVIFCCPNWTERRPDHWQVFFVQAGAEHPKRAFMDMSAFPSGFEHLKNDQRPAARFLDLEEAKRYAERHGWLVESREPFNPLRFKDLEPLTIWNRPDAEPLRDMDAVAQRIYDRLALEMEHWQEDTYAQPRMLYREAEPTMLVDMLPALSLALAMQIRESLTLWGERP